jgi:hypothetical protein
MTTTTTKQTNNHHHRDHLTNTTGKQRRPINHTWHCAQQLNASRRAPAEATKGVEDRAACSR